MTGGIAHLGTAAGTSRSMTSFVILGLGLVALAVVTYDAYRQHWS